MKKKLYILLFSTILSIGGANAQVTDLGFLTYLTDFKPSNMTDLSQYSRTLGTARSTAMAGAFTSLGADMSSMSINPAGLGMYSGSEFSISPSVSFSNFSNSRNDGISNLDGSKTNFGLANIGIALNVYQGARTLTSVTVGFSYNRLADYNSQNEYSIDYNNNSISEVFANQLNGIRRVDIEPGARPYDNYNIPTYNWGGVLAYQSKFIDPITDNFHDKGYFVGGIENPNVTNNHYMNISNSGSMGESNLSLGMNFSNVLYFGFSLGFKSLNYNTYVRYEENFKGNPDSPDKGLGYLSHMRYNQGMQMTGSGVDFKLGLTLRPISALRIGVAVHTPTYFNLETIYYADMYNRMTSKASGGFDDFSAYTNDLISTPNFTTPTRLLSGISYTFGQYAILSFDYERAWYTNMRLKEAGSGVENDFKQDIKHNYQAQDNIRVGVELRPLPQLFVRGGYYNSGTMLQNEETVFNAPIANKQSGFSLGLGYKVKNWAIDLAYSNSKTKYSMYDLYYYDNGTDFLHTGDITSELQYNVITLSTSIKF